MTPDQREDKAPEEVVLEVADGMGAEPRAARSASPSLTHPDRVLWEDVGLTKQGLAAFYQEIVDWILPHIVDRPLSLVRCPFGAGEKCFFAKHPWDGLDRHKVVLVDVGEDKPMFAIRDLSGVLELVQASVLEIHPWGSTLQYLDQPDRITFDLDPGEGVDWAALANAAREVRERLQERGLESFLKTTGGKGLHVVVPLQPKADWEEVRAFAQGIAVAMTRDSPDRYTDTMAKRVRAGRIFVDYLRNGRGATAVAAYSTRARPGAPVSTPLAWDELDMQRSANFFRVENLLYRLDHLRPDPWDGIASLGQVLPEPPRTANGRGARSNDVGVTRGAKQRDTQRPLGPEARLAVPRENIQLLLPDAVNPSKDQLAAYWTAVAGDALPYLARRPLKLVLHRRGVTYFHQGPLPPTPPSVHQLEITKREGERGIRLWVDDLAGLLGLAEMGAVEVHPWGARIEDIEHPDTMVFDFDPGDGVEWAFVTDTALRVRDLLKADGFAPWPKLTGGKGLHVVVPIAPDLGWTEVRAYSRQIAERAAATAPNRYTLSAKEDRTGRLYLDDMRNVRGIAAVGPYSPRARPGFPVAKPVTWRNVERGIPPDALTMEMLIENPGRTRTRCNGRTR